MSESHSNYHMSSTRVIPVCQVEVLADTSMLADHVSYHYSSRSDVGRGKRSSRDSVILRNLNNWTKTALIQSQIADVMFEKQKINRPLIVMDICCGKGGDLNKWGNIGKYGIGLLVMVDNARESVKHAIDRYNDNRDKRFQFPVRAAGADCYRVLLSSIPGLFPRGLFFDAVSCQFSFHYCFESEQRARAMMRNVSEKLRPGGIFIGTIPDANVLVKNCRASAEPDGSFGNSVFRVRFSGEFWDASNRWLNVTKKFGVKYYFTFNDAVEACPEFLVHFPTLEALAAEHDLELLYKANFHQIYLKYSDPMYPELRELLQTMVYRGRATGISKDDWETCYMYMGFAFQKVKSPGETDIDVEREVSKRLLSIREEVGEGFQHVRYSDIIEVREENQ